VRDESSVNRPDRLQVLLSVPALAAPEVSPDGRWLAWSWFRAGPAADVFAAPADGSAGPVRLTEGPEDALVVSWTPDSGAVIFEQDTAGDERAQLFRVDRERPGEAAPLTEPRPNFFLRGGELHPNGRWMVYGANLDAGSGREIEETWVYRHDLASGERRAIARPERSGMSEPRLSPTGEHVLYFQSDHPAGQQAWLVGIDGAGDRKVLDFGRRAKVSASWLPDGRRVLFLAETGGHRRLGVYDLRDGTLRTLIDDPQRNLEHAFAPAAGGPAVVVEVRGAGVRCSLLDVESGTETSLPDLSGNLIPLSPAGGGEWVGRYYSSRQPEDLVRFSPADGRPESFRSLTGLRDRTPLEPEELVPAEDYRWTSADGLRVQGWLYRAPGPASGTVVLVHGGPTSHSEDRFNAQVQYLVSRGLNVLTPNYRGSTGFGLPFQESIKEDGWGGREQEDIRTGIEAMIRDGLAEPGKVGVTGTSYGGYSAWWAITHYPPRLLAAAAPVCGMTDLVVDYYATRPDLRPYSEEMMGGSPEEVPEHYRARSPLWYVEDIRGSLLIVQGLRDPNVTPDNLRVVREALDGRGIGYELLTFEDEGHDIARPENLSVLYPRLADFFERAFSG
jgi:dipeptidyl aminopeptidase/acylaminoacyl peptidase